MSAAASSGARIALIAGQTSGGIGRHVVSLVPELVSRGAHVGMYGPAAMRDMAGAPFHPVEIPGGGGLVAGGRAVVSLIRQLRGADLVHAHGIRAGLAGGLAARLAGVPHTIVTVHNAAEGCAVGVAERLLAALAERRLYVSDDIAARARAAVPSRAGSVLVMPVGADVSGAGVPRSDLPHTAVARASLGLPEGIRLVVAVGRLARQKGFDVLVEAAALLDDGVIAVAGEGPERPMLEERIRQLPEGRVVLLGFRPDARVLTAAADVVCMPSRWEGSPLALHEAMAAGRPVVATAVGGIPALAGDAAILVPPDDPPALAAALRQVLGDPGLRVRMAEASLAAAARWPDAAATARRIADLYEDVLGCSLSSPHGRPMGRRRAGIAVLRRRRP